MNFLFLILSAVSAVNITLQPSSAANVLQQTCLNGDASRSLTFTSSQSITFFFTTQDQNSCVNSTAPRNCTAVYDYTIFSSENADVEINRCVVEGAYSAFFRSYNDVATTIDYTLSFSCMTPSDETRNMIIIIVVMSCVLIFFTAGLYCHHRNTKRETDVEVKI